MGENRTPETVRAELASVDADVRCLEGLVSALEPDRLLLDLSVVADNLARALPVLEESAEASPRARQAVGDVAEMQKLLQDFLPRFAEVRGGILLSLRRGIVPARRNVLSALKQELAKLEPPAEVRPGFWRRFQRIAGIF